MTTTVFLLTCICLYIHMKKIVYTNIYYTYCTYYIIYVHIIIYVGLSSKERTLRYIFNRLLGSHHLYLRSYSYFLFYCFILFYFISYLKRRWNAVTVIEVTLTAVCVFILMWAYKLRQVTYENSHADIICEI